MAVIRAFRHEVKGHGTRHSTDVDCLYFDFLDLEGSRILQLSTLGSEHRQSQPKVSQTFQIGAQGARELRRILDETFAGLGVATDARGDLVQQDSAASLGREPDDPIDRFVSRAGLERVEDLSLDETTARRRVLAHDVRPMVGGAWYIVDFTNVQVLRYVDVQVDRRSAPATYQRTAVVVNDISVDLEQFLVGAHANVIRLADLDLPTVRVADAVDVVDGTLQGDVPALQHMCRTLGVALAQPGAFWPGFGKSVPLVGGGSAYVNRTNVDVRGTPAQVAQWAEAGHGTVRGPGGQYLRQEYASANLQLAFGAARDAGAGGRSPVVGTPAAPLLSATFPWIEQLFVSETYILQKALAGRASLGDDVVRDVVNALVRLGLSAPVEVVEREAGFRPGALRPMVPLLRRLLNVDGYDTLSLKDEVLAIDEDLLRHQFGLSGPTLPEGDLL